MSNIKSNISLYYENLVADLADRAKLIHSDRPEHTRADCVNEAISDGFFEGCDQAYVMAYAFINGFATYGKNVTDEDYYNIEEQLFNDILDELQALVPEDEWE